MLPLIAEEHLASMVDIYVETIAFDIDDMRRLFEHALELGFSVRAHTEQLSNMHASAAAAGLGASSCDHLEHLDEDGVRAMAESNSVAVLLPGAYYFLRDTKPPPVDMLRRYGVPMAVATDLNPGTSPIASLLSVMHMAATLFGLTPDEVLLGVTRNAARVLGHEPTLGTLQPGSSADFSVWTIPEPDFLTYQLGGVYPDDIYVRGRRQ